jgi:purine nucleoside phosphorylase
MASNNKDNENRVRIGVIGGSGIYEFDHLKKIKEIYDETVRIYLVSYISKKKFFFKFFFF